MISSSSITNITCKDPAHVLENAAIIAIGIISIIITVVFVFSITVTIVLGINCVLIYFLNQSMF